MIGKPATTDSARYTNAKVLLVGESGVGKTGLAYRLIEDRFQDSISTGSTWATRDLQRAARRPFRKLLVAGRVDRGSVMVSRQSVDDFLKERGFSGYLETSALLGTGCDQLREEIIAQIPWDEIPWTASPRIFRLMKEEIIKLKDEGRVLMRLGELKQQIEMRHPQDLFTVEQLRAVVGLLAGPGVVWQLEFGDFVLLQPERINQYAASVIRSVRAHKEEIGCIAEEDVLAGRLDYQDVKRLPATEEPIVLRAMHQTFVDHGLCLREHTQQGTQLIFPSYFKRERPDLEGHPLVLVTYRFSGPLDEIYATLVVRLHHTPSFERDRLWKLAADFKTPAVKRLGIKMIRKPESNGELEIYFERGISLDVQVTFIRYVHDHLNLKARDVVRIRHYVCESCGELVENQRAIQTRLAKGLTDIVCSACEKRVVLRDLVEEKFASEEFQQKAHELQEPAKAAIDNESRELILVGHAFAIAGEAGQIYRQYTNSDHGIDGEIEFKDNDGKASGQRLYIQLKSGDSYLYKRRKDGAEVFTLKNERHADYRQKHAYPVMLVIRTSDGTIRWMNVTSYLQSQPRRSKQIIFDGEPLTALTLLNWRTRLLAKPIDEAQP